MKVLEVRDGFIKFDATDDVVVSSIIKIIGLGKSYIAQVIQLKKAEKVGIAKILFLYDGDLVEYDKTEPPIDSEVVNFSSEILDKISPSENHIIIGKFLGNNILTNASALDKKALVSVDSTKINNVVLQNIVHQLNHIGKKVVIIDSKGIIDAKKYIAGKNFKLPLDKTSLKFIYDECLSDATTDSKSMIIDIFNDLADYANTVEYLPYNVLKSTVDDMVDNSHIFKLLVLKNKLAKFDKLGLFANSKKEVDKIKKILSSKCSIIDISGLDSIFMNRYLNFVYENMNQDNFAIIELTDTISKKSLKQIFNNKVQTMFVCDSKLKFLAEIKDLFQNLFIFPSINNNSIFKSFGTFLKSMKQNDCLVVGEFTKHIPLISPTEKIKETVEFVSEQELERCEELEEVVNENISNETIDIIKETEETEETDNDEVSENEVNKEEIIANISDKSDTVINNIADNLEIPEKIDMFQDESSDDIQEEDFISEEDLEDDSAVLDEENKEFIEESDENEESSDAESYNYSTVTHENMLKELNEENNKIEPSQEYEIPIENITDDNQDEEIEINNKNENIENFDEPDEQFETNEKDDTVTDISNMTDEKEEDESIVINTDEIGDISDSLDIEDLSDELIEEPQIQTESFSEDDSENIVYEEETTNDFIEENSINNNNNPENEFIELDNSQATDDDILVEMDSEDFEKELDEQIKRDVDQVYTTIKENEVSESDLDFIDEIKGEEQGFIEEIPNASLELNEDDNFGNDVIEEYHSEEEQSDSIIENEILEKRDSSTPIVPVYDAEIPQEDVVMSDSVEQGDSVSHVKYGHGIVEKLVKYGSKTLYMINFDMRGRKLLDPLLTEIKKN